MHAALMCKIKSSTNNESNFLILITVCFCFENYTVCRVYRAYAVFNNLHSLLMFSYQILFGKSSCPELTKEVYTTVTYHSK